MILLSSRASRLFSIFNNHSNNYLNSLSQTNNVVIQKQSNTPAPPKKKSWFELLGVVPPRFFDIYKDSNPIRRPVLTKQTHTSTAAIMKEWNCHGSSQKELVQHLVAAGIITSPEVQRTLTAVDRQYYIPWNPYRDTPQPLDAPDHHGETGQTISAPHMHAHALEAILPHVQHRMRYNYHHYDDQPPIRILDVGCGSGYLTTAFARWFQLPGGAPGILNYPGQVYGMDVVQALVDRTLKNIQRADGDLLKGTTTTASEPTIQLRVGNGWQGWKEHAPFDVIHVGAAAADFPYELASQLAYPHGVMVVPIGPRDGSQHLYKIVRYQNTAKGAAAANTMHLAADYHITPLLGVRYVPLVNIDPTDDIRNKNWRPTEPSASAPP
jgi:protein-L-isoaspartate(D-aspartate) O-methyltransferase